MDNTNEQAAKAKYYADLTASALEMLELIRYTADCLGKRGATDRDTMENLRKHIHSQLGIKLGKRSMRSDGPYTNTGEPNAVLARLSNEST